MVFYIAVISLFAVIFITHTRRFCYFSMFSFWLYTPLWRICWKANNNIQEAKRSKSQWGYLLIHLCLPACRLDQQDLESQVGQELQDHQEGQSHHDHPVRGTELMCHILDYVTLVPCCGSGTQHSWIRKVFLFSSKLLEALTEAEDEDGDKDFEDNCWGRGPEHLWLLSTV